MDSRFSHITGDLRFKPLKSKTKSISTDDDRLVHLQKVCSI